MKRRVLIAKALSHEPRVLFLDEPTAGVDVELRRDMWKLVRAARARRGVTIILTTHYIDEAEEMADRIGVINKRRDHPRRREDRADAQARKEAADRCNWKPARCIAARRSAATASTLAKDGNELIYTYEGTAAAPDIIALLQALDDAQHPLQGSADHAEFARRHLREPARRSTSMNISRHSRDLSSSRWRAPGAR